MGSKKMRLSGMFYIVVALTLLIAPFRWICAAVFAAAFHELCHWTAIRLCGGTVAGFGIDSGGARMSVSELSRGREAICALAGPLGSFSLLLVARWMPRVSICALVQMLYNLLPIYPLDGGRVLRCGLSYLCTPPQTEKICNRTEFFTKLIIILVGIYAALILKLGLFPLLLSLLLLIRTK